MQDDVADKVFKKWHAAPDKKWVMISGPYTHGAKNAQDRQKNLDRLNKIALEVFKKGYIPIIGMNMALPIVNTSHDENLFDKMMMPVALALVSRCDYLLRVEGASSGADDETELALSLGKMVFYNINDIPRIL